MQDEVTLGEEQSISQHVDGIVDRAARVVRRLNVDLVERAIAVEPSADPLDAATHSQEAGKSRAKGRLRVGIVRGKGRSQHLCKTVYHMCEDI